MNILVNGKSQTLEEENVSVTKLLEINQVEQPDMVSVQLNGEFVNRADFKTTILKENDSVDFLYFMGGGSV